MKQTTFISAILISAAMAFAGGLAAQPESAVPTPAEYAEVSQGTPALGAKESANWQKMRAERKMARREILSRLKESSAAEKRDIRKDVSKKRNEKSLVEGGPKNPKPREREPFYERPDSHNLNPVRDVPPDPAPKGDRKPK